MQPRHEHAAAQAIRAQGPAFPPRSRTRRRRPELLAWAVIVVAFVFAFALVLAPKGSLVLSPMEHAQRQAEARHHSTASFVSGAISGLAESWDAAAE